jgi:hypothetical protein
MPPGRDGILDDGCVIADALNKSVGTTVITSFERSNQIKFVKWEIGLTTGHGTVLPMTVRALGWPSWQGVPPAAALCRIVGDGYAWVPEEPMVFWKPGKSWPLGEGQSS